MFAVLFLQDRGPQGGTWGSGKDRGAKEVRETQEAARNYLGVTLVVGPWERVFGAV